jgi:hypothetical protein
MAQTGRNTSGIKEKDTLRERGADLDTYINRDERVQPCRNADVNKQRDTDTVNTLTWGKCTHAQRYRYTKL